MLKCQLHTHVKGDPVDHILHSASELIDKAASFGYDVLAITCHRKIIFDKSLCDYAQKKNILLIPGIEFEIRQKHILGINIEEEIYQVNSFEKLRDYKKSHPDSLIIAAHPFFPGPSLKKYLIENIDCFDAIEYSWAYTKLINFNKKAEKTAKKYNKPLLATSDCHLLKYLDLAYCEINAPKDKKLIIETIKNGKLENYSRPTTTLRIARSLGGSGIRNIIFKKPATPL